MAVEEKVSSIVYRSEAKEHTYVVQFFDISSKYGQWYATAFDYESGHPKVFRCDKILSVRPSAAYLPKPIHTFHEASEALFKAKDCIDFEVLISDKGIDLFHKEHYPSMRLTSDEGQKRIQGFYNPGEEPFIADYFIRYADCLLAIRPANLKQQILDRLSALSKKFEAL